MQDQDEDLLEIDQGRLDEEWVNQPRLYRKYAAMAADSRQAFEVAKAARELCEADLSLAIRSQPARFGLDKVTEAAVEKTIITHEKYQQANREVIKAKHRLDLVDGIVQTLEHRKRSLEKLVDLHLAGYFAAPKASAANREQMNDAAKREIRKRGQYKLDKSR